MAPGHPPPARARGGVRISPSRTIRARLILSVAAVAAFGVALFAATLSLGTYAGLVDAAAALGLAVFVAGIALRRSSFVPWAVAAAALAYTVGRQGSAVIDGRAALVGAALLLAAELAAWSIEDDVRVRTERALLVRRAATIAGLVASALVIDVLLLGLAALSTPAGLVLATAGVTAAVACLGLVLRLARG